MKRHNYYKRNHSDPGRVAAVMLAVILAVLLPLRHVCAEKVMDTAAGMQEAVDAFTRKVGITGNIELDDYEEMIARLNGSGKSFTTELSVRHPVIVTEGCSDNDDTFVHGAFPVVFCAAHVHTRNCYAGHNHKAEGCTIHIHGPECYCSGRMTHRYRTESYSAECYICEGTGKIYTEGTCSECNGRGKKDYSIRCNACRGTGNESYWDICPKCGGDDPNCTRCNGSGAIDKKRTCTVCGGSGEYEKTLSCSNCNGKGIAKESVNCSNCDGDGRVSLSTSYYECAVCKKGSTTSYGAACSEITCGYVQEGYQCGYTENDICPICDQIIVDLQYESEQTVFCGTQITDLNTDVNVTYLNGSHSVLRTVIENSSPAFTEFAGTMAIQLLLRGYFGTASDYKTCKLPVTLHVIERTKVCERCGREYYPDGNGCPYCVYEPLGIEAVCDKSVYEAGEEPRPEVYLVFEDHTELLDYDNCWDTFDGCCYGIQTFIIGYGNFITELTVFVNSPEKSNSEDTDESSASDDSEGGDSEGENENNSGSSGTTGGTGSSEGTGTPTDTGDNDSHSDSQSGTDTEENKGENGDNGSSHVNGTIYSGGPMEVYDNDELMAMIYNDGIITLRPGDVLSVTVIPNGRSLFELMSGYREPRAKITSGVII